MAITKDDIHKFSKLFSSTFQYKSHKKAGQLST